VVGLALDSGFNPSIMRRLLTGFHWQRHADGRGGVPPVREACIPDLFTRIVALVAQYVQLITPPNPRTGGMGLTPHNALKFLVTEKHLGLDEALLKMFVNRLGIHPVGSLVRLNTGELALVLSPPEKPQQVHCPRVKIIREADGREIVGEWIDLANDSRTIARTVPAAGVGVNVGHYLFVS
jgi:hypothetical protein